MKKKTIIIGSGLGGLAIAVRLASRGHEVEIYEKRDQPGGQAGVFEINGYKFDGGPTLITAPFMLDAIWQAAGKKRADAFQLMPLDPYYRVLDSQGRYFDLSGDEERILAQIEQFNPSDRSGYLAYQDFARACFDRGFLDIANRPFLKATDLLSILPDLFRPPARRSVSEQTNRCVQDDFLRRILSIYPLMLGGSPLTTPSIHTLIHHLQPKWGVWYASGGTGTIVQALVHLFGELGGKIRFNTEVVEIVVQNRLVSGVRLRDGSVQRADIVVSNVDAPATYSQLIAPQHRRKFTQRRIEQMRFGMSLFVLYLGVRHRYPDSPLIHHNFILPAGYPAMLADIFDKMVLPGDFSLYVRRPSLIDPSLAPEGAETMCVVAPVPNLDARIDWSESSRSYRETILTYLEENYFPDLRANIVAEHHLDPLYFGDTLGCYKGAPFSLLPSRNQSTWFRPHNRSEEFENLYFTGAGTHPGAGLPGVLTSARLVDDLIAART